MNKTLFYTAIIALVILIGVIILSYNKSEPDLVLDVMKNRNIKDVYIPKITDYYEDLANHKNINKVNNVDGCDTIGSKILLWLRLKEMYGDKATNYMPKTFYLNDLDDVEELKVYYEKKKLERPNQMYILKNMNQRQEGIGLTRYLSDMVSGLYNGWYLAQEYIYNPFLIDGHKINMRYYLLVLCKNGKTTAYVHKNGFMYYTPLKYDENIMHFNRHITTGYIDRKIYDVNPLTHDDFRLHLDNIKKGKSAKWDRNAMNLLKDVYLSCADDMCKNKQLEYYTTFEIFGCDLAPDANLNAMIMEINKGPDLNAKDKRDKKVKLEVINDMFEIVEGGDINKTRFVQIY